MLPNVSPDFIHAVANTCIVFLWIWWLFHYRSGKVGVFLAASATALIFAMVYGWSGVVRIAQAFQVAVLPVASVFAFLVLMAFFLIMVISRRHAAERKAREGLPSMQELKCPHCKQRGYLYDYYIPQGKRGRMMQRMCSDCAARKGALLVDF